MSSNKPFYEVADMQTGQTFGPFDLSGELEHNFLDPRTLPAGLRPRQFADIATYTPDDLVALGSLGYSRVGVGVFLFDEKGRVVIGQHRPSEKNPNSIVSVPSETAQHWTTDDDHVIEGALATAIRCLQEELLITEGMLSIPAERSWALTHWPVGSSSGEQRKIFAPIVALGYQTGDEIDEALTNFRGSDEIANIDRVKLPDFLNYSPSECRRGLNGALISLIMADVILEMRDKLPPFLDYLNPCQQSWNTNISDFPPPPSNAQDIILSI